ncbi:aspartate dehydrogenase [Bacillus piscicola]|uniref:aspartate dehydrogenase n=1 Tax=Bacillus piscicola TaxID=1632684 RepID=UPI001F0A00DB|nr:aspartate dehydrogenase [Bacillus piscicola]
MNIGLIGTGNMAQFLLEAIHGENDRNADFHVVSLYGRNEKSGAELAASYHTDFYGNIDDFLSSPIDVVIEVATVQAAKAFSEKVLDRGKDLFLSSVGVMSDLAFYERVQSIATQNEANIYLPSGAIGGIDMIKSSNSLGGLKAVSITTIKSPKSLGLDESMEKEMIVFEGKAKEAIDTFPKNVNVSIILSLTGIGADLTNVTIVADPNVKRNTHTIEATGTFGKFHLTIENEPMPTNPKTSYLAALSILSLLQNKDQAVKLGN